MTHSHARSSLTTRTLSARWVRVVLWISLAVSSSACSVYTGTATTLKPQALQHEPGWIAIDGVPELRQAHELDCGPTALAMVFEYYGVANRAQVIAALPADQRVSASDLRDLAKRFGFEAFVVAGSPDDLVYELKHGRPVIVGVAKPTVRDALAHYEVVVGMHRESKRVATLDPAAGMRQNTFTGFLSEWQATGRVLLVVVPAGAEHRASNAAHGM
jgi:ABC-type bacteriocin/lantibiotic exporter with double-glycine peptidase domain